MAVVMNTGIARDAPTYIPSLQYQFCFRQDGKYSLSTLYRCTAFALQVWTF